MTSCTLLGLHHQSHAIDNRTAIGFGASISVRVMHAFVVDLMALSYETFEHRVLPRLAAINNYSQ